MRIVLIHRTVAADAAVGSRVLFLRSRGIERRRCICDILHLQCVRIVRTVRLVLVADARVGDYLALLIRYDVVAEGFGAYPWAVCRRPQPLVTLFPQEFLQVTL